MPSDNEKKDTTTTTTTTMASPEDDTPTGTTEVWDSKKQQAFVESGLKDPATQEYKKASEMGGVGPRTVAKLTYRGIEYAYELVGRFMEYKLDDDKMDKWLQDELHVKASNHRATIVGTVRKWCDQHL